VCNGRLFRADFVGCFFRSDNAEQETRSADKAAEVMRGAKLRCDLLLRNYSLSRHFELLAQKMDRRVELLYEKHIPAVFADGGAFEQTQK